MPNCGKTTTLNTAMKYLIISTIAAVTIALLALPAHGQGYSYSNSEWQRQQAQRSQQRELESQRALLDQQQWQLQRIRQEQERLRKDCEADYLPLVPVVPVTRTYTPTAQGREQVNGYIRQVMANTHLSHEAKMRLIEQALRSVR